jgi:hypothetical protein
MNLPKKPQVLVGIPPGFTIINMYKEGILPLGDTVSAQQIRKYQHSSKLLE